MSATNLVGKSTLKGSPVYTIMNHLPTDTKTFAVVIKAYRIERLYDDFERACRVAMIKSKDMFCLDFIETRVIQMHSSGEVHDIFTFLGGKVCKSKFGLALPWIRKKPKKIISTTRRRSPKRKHGA